MKNVTYPEGGEVFPRGRWWKEIGVGLTPPHAAGGTELFRISISPERKATGGRCAMAAIQDERRPEGWVFDPEVESSIFFPPIPIFLAGKTLKDNAPESVLGSVAGGVLVWQVLVSRLMKGRAANALVRGPTGRMSRVALAAFPRAFERILSLRCAREPGSQREPT